MILSIKQAEVAIFLFALCNNNRCNSSMKILLQLATAGCFALDMKSFLKNPNTPAYNNEDIHEERSVELLLKVLN
jgi:hypothetical protein